MQVDDAEDTVELVLQPDPIADCAQIIAEMQVAGGLNAGENAIHGIWGRL
jgi:hypothetical protein